MRCDAIMSHDPLTLRDSDSVGAAAEQLIRHRHLSVPVVDAEGRYVGMFGADDLLSLMVPRVAIAGDLAPNLRFVGDDARCLAERFGELKHEPVGALADRSAVVLAPDTPDIEAFRIFCRSRATLPVVEFESGRLLGVVSYWDVMSAVTAGI